MRLAVRQGVVAVVAGLLLSAPAGAQAVTPGPDPAFASGPDGQAAVPGGGSGIVADQPCLGDFNGDGNLDVGVPFVGNTTPTADGVVVMLGDGTGHLGTPTTPIGVSAGDQTRCATGDFNGDGRDDIAAVDPGVAGIRIALGQANGTFATSTIDTSTPVPTGTLTDIAVGDIDHDGKPDLAVTVGSPNEVVPFKGDGSGSFAAVGSPVALTAAPVFVTLSDVNNDNRADALVGLTGSSNFERASGQADGSLLSPAVGQATFAHGMGLGDFNGDGSVDVLTDGGGGVDMEIRLGNNTGSFTSSGGTYPSSLNPSLNMGSVNAADYNNDGLPDGAVGGQNKSGVPAQVWTFKNEGSSTPPLLDQTAEGPFQLHSLAATVKIATGDLNNDGRLDIVGGTITGGRVGVLLNTTAVPGAVTGPASSVTDDGATINGTVFPSGLSTQYGIDFISPTGAVDHRPSAGSVGGSGSQPVSFNVNGLTPDTTYRYRLYGTSSNGTTVGKILSFHTGSARAVNQSPPTLSGNPVPGNVLTCGDGTWSDSPTFTVAWLRGGVVIGGESAHTYTVQPGDVGSAVGCRVTATNANGSRSADSPTFLISAVPPGAPQNVTAPTVSGQAKVGAPLACNAGSWTAGGNFTYAWLRDGVAIPGATTPGFVVRKSDAGHKIVCRVTLTNKDGNATASSAPVAIPLPACIVPKLRGLTLKSAKSRLKAAHCGVGKITRKKGTGVKNGQVLSSSPKAGVHRPGGTKVKLTVRK